MKYLTIVRHAKSSWSQPGLADHDRPLNDRGRRAAPAVARFLWSAYLGGQKNEPLLPVPDRVISSTALRALSTAQIMREVFTLSPDKLILETSLYLAPESRLLGYLQQADESWNHLMIVGHNPGLHDFVNRLLARAKISRFPTCSVALLACPTEFWSLLEWNEAQLIGLVTPKLLSQRFPDLYEGISPEEDD